MIDRFWLMFLLFCYGVIAVLFLISLVRLLFRRDVADWKMSVKSQLIALAVIFAFNVFAKAHALSDETDWKHYMFYIGSPTTGDDALRFGRHPEKVEYSYGDKKDPDYITYIRLYYDGYCLGMFHTTESKIGAVRVTEPGIIPLHGGIDIGSTRAEVEAAFADIGKMGGVSEGEGYIFRQPHEHAYDGVWLYLEYDENDILVEFTLTDGL